MQMTTGSDRFAPDSQTLQLQTWHKSAFPSQGLWIYSESYTLVRLKQSALGCRSRAGVTHGCRYSQTLSAKGCKGEQSTDALRESEPSHLHYCYHNRQPLGDCHVIGKITLCYVVIGFITCNPQASGVYPQKRAQLGSLGSLVLKKEPPPMNLVPCSLFQAFSGAVNLF